MKPWQAVMDKEKTWFHSTGNGTRNQYDRQQIQSCRNAKHRSADEGRTGTNQRTGVKCNVTGSHTGHHSHKQRIKIWQQENLSFFQPPQVRANQPLSTIC